MVFVKKQTVKTEDVPMFYLLNKKEKVGDIGLEIEVEGKRLPKDPPSPWVYKQDGSLRGAENAEYILSAPIHFKDVDDAVDKLWALFVEKNSVLDDSNRTSVHVHLNVLSFYMNRLAALMGLWFTFEDLLSHWCGEHRVGNLFALRGKDAPMVVRRCAEFVKGEHHQFSEGNHYAAMSPYAINKFGSLEFRLLRGVTDPDVLKTWVNLLKTLYDISDNYKDPSEICNEFSYNGPMDFFRSVFGSETALSIQDTIGWTDEQVRDSLYEGIRFAQDICYARDWKNFNPQKIVVDPFGRQPAKKRKASAAGLNFVDEDEDIHQMWDMPAPSIAQAEARMAQRVIQRARNNLFLNNNPPAFGEVPE